MKKDIDLLSGFNEAKDKKSSSSSSLLVVIVVLALIGVMLFLFMTAKNDIKLKKEEIAALDQRISKETLIAGKEQQFEAEKARYDKIVEEAIGNMIANGSEISPAQISSKVITIIFDNYANILDENAMERVQIGALNVTAETISFTCRTRTYQDAWDFVDYMRGQPLPPLGEGATEAETEAYNIMSKRLEANKRYFSKVLDSYPGLPVEGDGTEYSISFSLTITVNWGAIVQDEAN